MNKRDIEKLKAERDFYKHLSEKYADLIRTLLNHDSQLCH